MDEKNHGGKREGAGRPRKADSGRRVLVNFTFSSEVIGLLRTRVGVRQRSKFVEAAIMAALEQVGAPLISSPTP